MTSPQSELQELMSEISCLGYEASWMEALEFDLWEIACGAHSRGHRYGQHELDGDALKRLVVLARAAGGWFHWPAHAQEAQFVALENWRELYSTRRGRDCPELK